MKSQYQISDDYISIIDSATRYLHDGKVPVIGHGSFSREFLAKLKMPHLPLLADNKKEREHYATLIAPWYVRLGKQFNNGLNIMASHILRFLDYIGNLYDAEISKQFIPHNDLAYIELPKAIDPKEDEEVPEEKEVLA